MQKHYKGIYTLFLLTCALVFGGVVNAADSPTSEEAKQRLMDGNERFVNQERSYPHLDKERLKEIAKGQSPYATIISCSDSRVAPEHLFDVGLGDIFVIRVAGNVCDTDEIGSIEYGIHHLETPLLVVLGHTSCGAVMAVVQNAEVSGSIPQLVDNIQPAVVKVQSNYPDLKEDKLVHKSVVYNVWQSIEDLFSRSEAARELVAHNKLKVVGAVYDLNTGKVEWLGQHPKQDDLLKSETDS